MFSVGKKKNASYTLFVYDDMGYGICVGNRNEKLEINYFTFDSKDLTRKWPASGKDVYDRTREFHWSVVLVEVDILGFSVTSNTIIHLVR